MSLTSALQLGRSALATSQAALEVTGNNLSNAATEGYTRQKAVAAPGTSREIAPGTFMGSGVRLEQIARQVNEGLNQRMRAAGSDHHAALSHQQVLSQIESIRDDLGDASLGSRMEQFFDAWTQLADNPTDESLKGLVISEGESLGSYFGQLRSEMVGVRDQVDDELRSGTEQVNELLDRVAGMNERISRMEAGAGGVNSLRDERDQVLSELSEYLDISVVNQSNGMVDVHVGSTPLVVGQNSRGLDLEFESTDEGRIPRLRAGDDGDPIRPTSGKLAQLIASRTDDVQAAVDTLDTLAHHLMGQVNSVHSSGQASRPFEQATAVNGVEDTTAALDQAGLPFEVRNGSFNIHVTQQSTGQRTSHRIDLNLDGSGGGTSMDDVTAAIDAVSGLDASLTADGRLEVATTSSDFRFTFSEDTSGLLSAAGLNTLFTGTNASDMNVHAGLKNNPAHLAVTADHVAGGNETAKAVAALVDQPVEGLGGASLKGYWSRHVEDYASRTAQANQEVESTSMIAESLQAQWESTSGVNIDEEAIDMLAWQRSYQGAARFIGVVDEMMQTLLTMTP